MDDVESVPEPQPEMRPWGAFATLGLTALVFVLFLALQLIVMIVAAMGRESDANAAASLAQDGDVLSVATLLTGSLCVIPLLLFSRGRPGFTTRQYLALVAAPVHQYVYWLGALALYIIGADLLTSVMGRPISPDFMIEAYSSLDRPVLLWISIVVAAPFFEEIFFRGFIFRGLRHSRLGGVGAVLMTSLMFTLIHMQYGFYELSVLFVAAVLLGVARLRTGSVLVPMAMHAMMNLVGITQVALLLADRSV